jgi:hypothetical protein
MDPGFPAAGTRFHHQVGIGPLRLNDHTQVIEVRQPERLVLKAKARPLLGTAIVDLTIRSADGGSHVWMREGPGDPLTVLFFNPLTDPLVHKRNDIALRRLKELCERRPDIGRHVKVPPGKIDA